VTHTTPRRLPVVLLIAAFAAIALLLALRPPTVRGESNLNNLNCKGHIEKGEAGPVDEEDEHQVKYVFACDGPITGYSILLPRGVEAFDTEVSVFDRVTKDGVATDSFACAGEIPGIGFNCTGRYAGGFNNITGQFSIKGRLDRKPLINPRLVVATATVSSGAAVQSMSGPYSLGTPRGIRKAGAGKTRSASKSTTKKAARKTAKR
jgi:hypothetical protein